MTQVELAKKLNTTKQTIGKYENEIVTNLPLNRIQELADALDTTPAYLMGWSDNEKSSSADNDNLTSVQKSAIDLIRSMDDADLELFIGILKTIRNRNK